MNTKKWNAFYNKKIYLELFFQNCQNEIFCNYHNKMLKSYYKLIFCIFCYVYMVQLTRERTIIEFELWNFRFQIFFVFFEYDFTGDWCIKKKNNNKKHTLFNSLLGFGLKWMIKILFYAVIFLKISLAKNMIDWTDKSEKISISKKSEKWHTFTKYLFCLSSLVKDNTSIETISNG